MKRERSIWDFGLQSRRDGHLHPTVYGCSLLGVSTQRHRIQLLHLLQYPMLAFADIGARCVRSQAMRVGQHGGQRRGIFGRQPIRRFVKVALRRSFNSVHTIAEFHDVQISFQDAAVCCVKVLAPRSLLLFSSWSIARWMAPQSKPWWCKKF